MIGQLPTTLIREPNGIRTPECAKVKRIWPVRNQIESKASPDRPSDGVFGIPLRQVAFFSDMAGPRGRVTNQVLENFVEWHGALAAPRIADVFSLQEKNNAQRPDAASSLAA